MKFLILIFTFVLFIQMCLCQRSGQKFKVKGDYMDVPVRASYKIQGNDDDGFLEDGIIVKTKGSGYIDSRFKNRDPYRGSASQVIYGRPAWYRQ